MSGCRFTSHVLDVTAGRPASGVTVEIVRLDPAAEGGVEVVTSTTTDDDGRLTDAAGVPALAPGLHEARVDLGAYFATSSTPTFYEVVPVRFVVGPTDEHIHLALLASPWSYTTYRGS